jgi:hypothetical protein
MQDWNTIQALTVTEMQWLFQGPSLQSERCGDGAESWGCLLSPSSSLPVDHPGVVAEVGPACRCGCVVHLGVAKPRRILATSTASCPGRTFWLIQVIFLLTAAYKYSQIIFRLISRQYWVWALWRSLWNDFFYIIWHSVVGTVMWTQNGFIHFLWEKYDFCLCFNSIGWNLFDLQLSLHYITSMSDLWNHTANSYFALNNSIYKSTKWLHHPLQSYNQSYGVMPIHSECYWNVLYAFKISACFSIKWPRFSNIILFDIISHVSQNWHLLGNAIKLRSSIHVTTKPMLLDALTWFNIISAAPPKWLLWISSITFNILASAQ